MSECLIGGIPFLSQRLVVDSVAGITPYDVEHWSKRSCGVACVRMILLGAAKIYECANTERARVDSLWELIHEGLQDNAYSSRGWVHTGLQRMLARRGVHTESRRNLEPDSLARIIEFGHLAIASVSPGFRGGETLDNGDLVPKGGHWVVVNGVQRAATGVYLRCHHPGSCAESDWANEWIDQTRFEDSFSGNAIEVLWSEILK